MWWPKWFQAVLLWGLLLFLPGCGYQFPARSAADLPQGISRLHLESIQDTSGEPGLQSRLRALFTEEIELRTGAEWTDREQSQGLVVLDIQEYRVATSLENAAERTVKSEARIRISARILDRQSGEQLWESGTVTGRESFTGQGGEGPVKNQAEREALERAVEGLVQQLGHRF
ncbi:MAG: LPS assembly lipoprotein LptE [Desulfohalobiaceae bacterium]